MKKGVVFEEGLSNDEFEQIERKYHFKFPPDLREFLSVGLPVSPGFVNWRNGPEEDTLWRLNWPFSSLCFDVKYSNFWLPEWGNMPRSYKSACITLRKALDKVPKLIPIYLHRYIFETPYESGNPVVSMHGLDTIYYGKNLWEYFEKEFFEKPSRINFDEIKKIDFWPYIMENWFEIITENQKRMKNNGKLKNYMKDNKRS